jgi:hypothetical protein
VVIEFILSKSKFVRGSQCFKMLYLDLYKPNLADGFSLETQKKFKAGRNFEKTYKDRFTHAVDLSKIYKAKFSSYIPATTKLLAAKNTVDIVEAGFLYANNLILVDVFQKLADGTYIAHEIKNSLPLEQNMILENISPAIQNDNVFQFYVLYHLFGEKLKFNLVLKGKNEGFKIIDRTHELKETLEQTHHNINTLRQSVNRSAEPYRPVGPYCQKPYECVYLRHCEAIDKNAP